jgi:hypothetical protein
MAGVVVCLLALALAAWADARARAATRAAQDDLAAARVHQDAVRALVAKAGATERGLTSQRAQLGASMFSTQLAIDAANSSLGDAQVAAYLQGVGIATLQTCLGGIERALGALRTSGTGQAAADLTAVSGPCAQVAGGSANGLVYPFDFPDPAVLVAGNTTYAYATNSVAGNIQIIESTDLAHWSAVGNALPSLPSWAAAGHTWAPSVAFVGGTYDLYYAVDPAGSTKECISVATARTPTGPFTDSSSAPLECQKALGGSIDPSAFVDAGGTPYLLWKSGGAGDARIWSQQLAPSGVAFTPGSTPTVLLSPDQPWQAGTVEAPDLVEAGGHYELFFSGNDWNTARYAVGVASCAGPSGPCASASPKPILASGTGVAGPGGASVFADSSGQFWIAFAAWIPGAVGFPHSRDLFLRRLDLSGPVASVAGASGSTGATGPTGAPAPGDVAGSS